MCEFPSGEGDQRGKDRLFELKGKRILATRRDTGLIRLVPRPDGYIPTQEDRAVFTVCDRSGEHVLAEKTILPEEDGSVFVPFTQEDTLALETGIYLWSVRYALEAVTDEKGKVTGGREMITPFAPGMLCVTEVIGTR